MSCTKAKALSNRINAQKSTGPRTIEGKTRSRRNSLKHGLTGAGIVLPGEDAAAVAIRFDEIIEELNPQSALGMVFAEQIAIHSTRLRRCFEHEHACLAENIRLAESEALEARLSVVDDLFDGLHKCPDTCARRLQSFPEGVDRMLKLYDNVRTDLTDPTRLNLYSQYHFERLEALDGKTPEDFPSSRVKALSQAMFGQFKYLDADEGYVMAMTDEERAVWAKKGLVAIIDDRVLELKARRIELAPRAALVRSNLTEKARLSVTAEAQLARKYEGTSYRALTKSFEQYYEAEERFQIEMKRRAEEEEAEATEAVAAASEAATSETAETSAAVGSSCQNNESAPVKNIKPSANRDQAGPITGKNGGRKRPKGSSKRSR